MHRRERRYIKRFILFLRTYKTGVGVGVVVSLLLVGTTALFKSNVDTPPYALVFASRSYADLTLFSGFDSDSRHTLRVHFSADLGNPQYSSENEDVNIDWNKSAQLIVKKGPRPNTKTVSIVSKGIPFEICFSLNGTHLYGGPVVEKYPSEMVPLARIPFITGDGSRMGKNTNVLERYWYTSGGLNLHVDSEDPLFLTQNKKELCLAVINKFPYTKDVPLQISYTTCLEAKNLKDAVKCFFPNYANKPIPPKSVIAHPIWSTWVEFKSDINQQKVIKFESDIRKHGFNASVMEVDDAWETCYGTQDFDRKKFPDPKAMVDLFHSFGHLVTFWVHPFVGPGCPPATFDNYQDHLVRSSDGSVGTTTWWNGNGSLVNFFDLNTTKWFINRLEGLKKTYGIDGFKFDAGEAAYIPGMSIKEKTTCLPQPNLYTTKYVEMAAHFGTLTEVRVGAESNNQKLMQRLQDTNSVWEEDNLGLRSVIPSVLQLSLMGYGAILPDMIGGNCYNNHPSKELFIRWIQLNTFLPVIQFSLTPWSFDDETIAITKKFTSLHYAYTDRILKEFNDKRHPVINPIWWISPEDVLAQEISTEFLLGEDLLVAPVVEEGARSRDIYLPVGKWIDKNTGKVHKGPVTLRDYPAPLDVLPYFERKSKH